MSEGEQAKPDVTGAEIRAQLECLLASRALAGSEQLRRLLRLTVERTISNQSALLKEYNLGLEVFNRPPDYDPKVDPIVRVQARRLRAKLDEYYANEGSADQLIIQIPKGAYIPVFERRLSPALTPLADPGPQPGRRTGRIWLIGAGSVLLVASLVAGINGLWKARPTPQDLDRSVAVLPLKSFTTDAARASISDEVTELLTTELAKSKQLRLLSRTTAAMYRNPTIPLPDIARKVGVRWILEGGVGSEGSRIYVKLRLVDSMTDRKSWADVYDCDVSTMVEVNAGVAQRIEAAIQSRLAAESAARH